jgi:Septum formation
MSVAERSQQLLASELGRDSVTAPVTPISAESSMVTAVAGVDEPATARKSSGGTSKRKGRAHEQSDSLKLTPTKPAAATAPNFPLSKKAIAALVLGAASVVAPFASIPYLRDYAAGGVGRIAGYVLVIIPLLSLRFARSTQKTIAEPRRLMRGRGLTTTATILSLLGFLFGAVVYGNWLVGARFHEGDARVVKIPVIGSIELPQSNRRNVLPGSAALPAYDGVKVGDCVTNVTGALPTEKFNVVDCANPHVGEVIALGKIDEATTETSTGPLVAGESFEAREQWVGTRCQAEFAAYVGGPIDATAYDVKYFFPADTSWKSGYRDFLCLLTEQSDGTTSGSAKPTVDPAVDPATVAVVAPEPAPAGD